MKGLLRTTCHDPRQHPQLSPRDRQALAFIGGGYEVAQYQLAEAVFQGRAPNVVSRFVRRTLQQGLIAVERWNRIGINRLRLTPRGRDVLVDLGVAREQDLFAPRRSVAPKDTSHTLWINDLRVACSLLPQPPDVVSAAWLLQRRLHPAPRVVPDLLAIWKPRDGSAGILLAVEVDLGGESLRGVFLPKLRRLEEEVEAWRGDAAAFVLVFSESERRVNGLIVSFRRLQIREITILQLPRSEPRARIHALRSLLLQTMLQAKGSAFFPEAASWLSAG